MPSHLVGQPSRDACLQCLSCMNARRSQGVELACSSPLWPKQARRGVITQGTLKLQPRSRQAAAWLRAVPREKR
eukprot:1492590-Alexandrium_andersonii.AAC.1